MNGVERTTLNNSVVRKKNVLIKFKSFLSKSEFGRYEVHLGNRSSVLCLQLVSQ